MAQGAAPAGARPGKLAPLVGAPSRISGGSVMEKITSYTDASTYNNYYEFGTDKADPAQYAHTLQTKPWTVEVEGLVKKPTRFDLDDLLKLSPMLGSDTLAWASAGWVTADTVRRSSALSFAIGLDLAIWSLFLLASHILAKPSTVSENSFRASELVLPKDVTDAELDELRKLLTRSGPLTNNDVARMLGVVKSEASKRVSKAVAAGMVSRRRIGREVSIQTVH